MPWSDTMTVEVGYVLADEATEDHVRSLRSGAKALTDRDTSIRVERSRKGDTHAVIVTFTMRKMAQYKVVGDISHRFKMSFASHYIYSDTWIRFPR